VAKEERGSFSPEDISDEIERLNRGSKKVTWNCNENLAFELVIPPTVYPPREDTDLIAQQIATLGEGNGRNALEIGCGSGALSILLCAKGWQVSACDINPYAVAASRGNLATSGFEADIVECGPGSRTRTWLQKKPFDLIIWNLPYLERPAQDSELLGPFEESSLSDLEDEGVMELLARSITCEDLLTKDGKALIVHRTDKDVQLICHRWGLAARKMATREFAEGTDIQVTCIWHPWSNSPLDRVHSTTSTNEDLLSLYSPVGSHLTTNIQTSGRGRKGRHWRSADGCYAGSWVISTGDKVDAGVLQLAAGIAVIDAIQCFTEKPLQLKWPNDILIGKRKVCGILAEGRVKGNEMRAVIGIGINLKHDAEVLTENEASLDEFVELLPEQVDMVLHASLASLLETKAAIPPVNKEGIISRASLRIKALGDVFYRGNSYTVNSIADDGKLIINHDDGPIEIDDGETIEWLNLR
jgi:biotin-[acetyl-CoA-carboxylase] ligase BirA-like protein